MVYTDAEILDFIADYEDHAPVARMLRQLRAQRDEARDGNTLLCKGIAANEDEICQTLGKALCYPWFKDDQKNFPGSTEEQGVCVGDHVAASIAAEAAKAITAAKARINELEEALKPFAEECNEWKDSIELAADSLRPLIKANVAETSEEARFTVGDLRRARSTLQKEPLSCPQP